MRFWLIDVRDAVSAVAEHLHGQPDDTPPDAAELRELAALALKYVAVSCELLKYAEQVAGRPRTD